MTNNNTTPENITALPIKPRRWDTFLASLFFVLGFAVVFSLLGVLLQTTLAFARTDVKIWLGRLGGAIIIFFGLFLLRLITPSFLEREHAFAVKRKFSSKHLTSFVFGAAFAVGWTPCVSAALGAILALAAVNAGSAFVLLSTYTLGLGIPFLLVGLFANEAQTFINKAGPWLKYVQYVFGVLLIILGIFIFTGELSRVTNFQGLTQVLISLHVGTSVGGKIMSLSAINLFLALFAGLVSFLSPCILPIIPGFLSFLAGTSTQKTNI